MNHQQILWYANAVMAISFIAFVATLYLSYGLESQLPLMLVTYLHLSQLFLAGIFKVSYVVRLASQSQLGLKIV